MCTVIVMGLGLVIREVCLPRGITQRVGGAAPATAATAGFLVLWWLAARSNLCMGVSRTGYASARNGASFR